MTPLGNALEGRVAVVTGAAGGMGRGICTALLDEGALVVMSDLADDAIAAARAELDPSGERTLAVSADVCDAAALEQLASRTVEELGKLDCWVNNAGVIEMGAILETTPERTRREFDVNVHALLEGCRAAARQMAANGGGSIVNLASNAGKVGFPLMLGYNASKAAVINLTRGLAAEWAPLGINVNAVCPGSVQTAMLETVADVMAEATGTARDEMLEAMGAEQIGRHIEPVEVGRVIAFLLSDSAAIVRGQSLNVDAGTTPY